MEAKVGNEDRIARSLAYQFVLWPSHLVTLTEDDIATIVVHDSFSRSDPTRTFLREDCIVIVLYLSPVVIRALAVSSILLTAVEWE